MFGSWRRRMDDERLGITDEMVRRADERDRLYGSGDTGVRHAPPDKGSKAEQDDRAAKKAFDERQAKRAKANLDLTTECPELEDGVSYSISDPSAAKVLRQLRMDAEAARHARDDDDDDDDE